jgi:hypothetical protein
MQPLAFLFSDMAEDKFARRWSGEMDVGGLPAHGVEKAKFSIGCAQRSEIDAGAVRGETTNDPASAQLDERIGTTHGTVDDGLVKDFRGAVVVLSPGSSRRDQSLGLARDAATVKVGYSDIARMAETAESGNAVSESIGEASRRQEMFDSVDCADGSFSFQRRKRVDFLPEANGISKLTCGNCAEPGVLLAKDEGTSLFAQAFTIAAKNGVADIGAFDWKASGLGGEVGADGEAHLIDSVSRGPGFIEVVDSPDEAAFNVSPGPEVLDMEIANGENAWGMGEIRTDLRPDLRPTVKRSAEKHEEVRLHIRVFKAEILLIDMSALGQPGFKLARGLDDVHARNDSDGKREKSNESFTTVTSSCLCK